MPFCSPAEQNLVERSYVLHKFLWIISFGGEFYAESCIFFWELPPEKKCKKSLETRDFAFGCRNEKGGDSASPPKEDRLWRLQFRLTGCSRCWRYESGQRWRIPGSEHMRQNGCGTTAWATTFPPCAKRFAMACSAIYTPFSARRCAFPCRTDEPAVSAWRSFPCWRMSCLPSSLNPSAQPECRRTR